MLMITSLFILQAVSGIGEGDEGASSSLSARVAVIELLTRTIQEEMKSLADLRPLLVQNQRDITNITNNCDRFITQIDKKSEALQVSLHETDKQLQLFRQEQTSGLAEHAQVIEELKSAINDLRAENLILGKQIEELKETTEIHELKFDKVNKYATMINERLVDIEKEKEKYVVIVRTIMKIGAILISLITLLSTLQQFDIIDLLLDILYFDFKSIFKQ